MLKIFLHNIMQPTMRMVPKHRMGVLPVEAAEVGHREVVPDRPPGIGEDWMNRLDEL